jgi:bacillithiol system protein YtxJ
MDWIHLEDYSQIKGAIKNSEPFLIFKHSTRCSISSMAKNRFERNFDLEDVKVFYLDLIKYRSISNQLASDFNVHHESPQLMYIKEGRCLYHASHGAIDVNDLKASI